MGKQRRPLLGPRILNIFGNALIIAAVVILVFTFWPVAKEEIRYKYQKVSNTIYVLEGEEDKTDMQNRKNKKIEILIPPNTNFSIVIPKIAAVAPVFSDIDSQNSDEFLPILKKGVVHAKGTVYPGQEGNVYIFAHSTDSFYNVGHYNAVFYLLGKLKEGDEIVLYYANSKYIYSVEDVKVIDALDVKYLGKIGEGKTLTLQTCYPPGTTLRRLVVLARQVD